MLQPVIHGRPQTGSEVLNNISQNVHIEENRLRAMEQTLNRTLEAIERSERKNDGLKSDIIISSTITSGSVGFIALSAFSVPFLVAALAGGGTAWITYQFVTRSLTRK